MRKQELGAAKHFMPQKERGVALEDMCYSFTKDTLPHLKGLHRQRGVCEQEFGGAKRFMSREEREAQRWEDAATKENAKLRVAQEREAKRMAEQADKERRAAVRKQDTERRRQYAPNSLHCDMMQATRILVTVRTAFPP